MNSKLDLSLMYDTDMKGLLESENISDSLLKKVILNHFEHLDLSLITKHKDQRLTLPFVTLMGKKYSIHFSYKIKGSKLRVQILLLAVTLKSVKTKI